MSFTINKTNLPDDLYVAQLATFFDNVAANSLQLGLTDLQVDELMAKYGQLSAAMAAVREAKVLLAAAVTEKDHQRGQMREIVSALARNWRADLALPDTLLEKLMLAPHRPGRSIREVQRPTELIVEGDGLGKVTLTWATAGNIRGTVYVIEQAATYGGPWTIVDSQTASKYVTQHEPGQPIWLRVWARRGNRRSHASLPVGLWGGKTVVEMAA